MDVGDGTLPRDLGLASTHAVGVADALELGRAVGRTPHRVVLVGVEGVAFGMGEDMSPAVASALDEAVATVLAELGVEESCTSER